ncbi:putative damage-inducible protein DinB [Spirosoma lacussanchae]|uniref:DinB family protein n=1 Tax=Spirosoma lacussanchae TaxID=1884249 RepID=UPI001109465A|nr:DinB family protein [Spirosoma lacussanchae]
MALDTLQALFRRDLERLRNEIDAYQSEEQIWAVDGQIPNSAGNLCLHLVGNLNTYIGAELGKTGYVRDRPAEFALKGISKAVLINQVEQTITVVEQTLRQLDDQQLEQAYPIVVLNEPTTTGFLLIHLATHLGYHLGQINYHRRLLDQ